MEDNPIKLIPTSIISTLVDTFYLKVTIFVGTTFMNGDADNIEDPLTAAIRSDRYSQHLLTEES